MILRVGQHRGDLAGDSPECVDCDTVATDTDCFRTNPACRRWR